MSAYLIGQVRIHDPEGYSGYVAGFRAQMKDFTGEVLVGSETATCLEGGWPWTKTVILRFETEEDALTWYNSDAYQEIARIRHAHSDCNLVLVNDAWAGRATAR